MKVLIVDSGGRGGVLAWKIAQSPLLTELFIAPGNTGTGHIAENIGIEITDVEGLREFVIKEKIDLTVVGSEESLNLDIVDAFRNKGLKIFGPCGHDAQLESSKAFGKFLMKEVDIPTAGFEVFSDYREASLHLNDVKFPAVIKVDGLASGKGVYVCETITDGKRALKSIMVDRIHGDAGRVVVIEEYLEGEEYSAHALISGKTIVPFPISQDYKRFNGQNTGGMGARAPVGIDSVMYRELGDKLTEAVTRPVIDHLARLKGHSPIYDSAMCIYPGLIITSEGPRVLEFNVRFGDPEAQVLLPLMKTDFLEVLLACVEGRLSEVKVEWYENLYAVCVALVSKGYPGEYKIGFPITGIDKASIIPGVTIFHAGTKYENGQLVTNGGRVVYVVGEGDSLEEAGRLAYIGVKIIDFEGKRYIDGIGL